MTIRPWPGLLTATLLLAGCASSPDVPLPEAMAEDAPATGTQPGSDAHREKLFQDAARGYRVVEKDGRKLYCKREKVLGSTIPTLQCLSEAQLRMQVENTEIARDRLRNGTHCTLGRSGGACGGS